MWGATLHKSIFPYGAYHSVEELRNAVEFPPEEAFFNQLKQKPVKQEEYKKAKAKFDKGKQLPVGHPDKITSMACWLRMYNLLDVLPLVEAVNNSFEAFHQYFGVDGNQHHSLPSMAFTSLFKQYPEDLPYVQTFNHIYDEILSLIHI